MINQVVFTLKRINNTAAKTASRALRATSLVARGMAMPPLVAELRTRLGEELDYEQEAAAQKGFVTATKTKPGKKMPTVATMAPGTPATR